MIEFQDKNFATYINQTFFSQFVVNDNLRGINSGQCYYWAYYAYCLFPVSLWTTDYHAWVKLGNYFYDSESPEGVPSYMNLRCNYMAGWKELTPMEMPVKEFKTTWNLYGRYKPINWDGLVSNIRIRGLSPFRF